MIKNERKIITRPTIAATICFPEALFCLGSPRDVPIEIHPNIKYAKHATAEMTKIKVIVAPIVRAMVRVQRKAKVPVGQPTTVWAKACWVRINGAM